ncbi:MAG: aminopeptidase [Bacteroidales bacterium]|nr:aminopeptidase [Bacteroidales bacterium]MCM1417038.1 aminopeptidase [bacterium]MCM1422419.1 aminopeptidase [bacterium]
MKQEEIIMERYDLALARIKEIPDESICGEAYRDYFMRMADFVLLMDQTYELVESGALAGMEMEELKAHNRALYEDILPEHYKESYGNPSYAVDRLGESIGQMLSFLYTELRAMIPAAYEGNRAAMLIRAELLLEVYQAFVCAAQETEDVGKEAAPDAEALRQILYWFVSDYYETEFEEKLTAMLYAERDHARRIIMESDLSDLRYLYYFGEYITENELKTAAHLNETAPEKIKLMADTYTEGYRIGFEATNKDLSIKETVQIRYFLGFERVIRQAVQNFDRIGLQSTFCRAGASIFQGRSVNKNGYCGANPNKQYDYDHKEDMALFLDGALAERKVEAVRNVFERHRESAALFGGPAVVESFGEEPFVPENKEAVCRFSEKQQKLSVFTAGKTADIQNAYIKGEERSFTIIAFPVPEIGDRYEEIFDDVVRINTLDYMLYREIQQKIIDVLDTGLTVLVNGANGNETDMKVQLHRLEKPESQTNFENCVADVNIPVGEVFTSPRLAGTEGVLHVTRVFLNGLEYRDLRLRFRDGFVEEYSCKNFPTEEENRSYIKDNVLFHHDRLPLGEFAIGTNTTAYRVARKYGIEEKLPILIAEKTGPHFALGDTCYSHEEELHSFNPDGKEIVAKENEVSVLRDTDVSKAYFQCHTDITIPYDELGELSVLTDSGEKHVIIQNGQFVLSGCEELNRALAE